MNPYLLPAGNVQIAFSGGRTSAFMLHQILEANGSLPDRVRVSFQNTGCEMPETYDFVHECAQRWNVDVVWLEYRRLPPLFEVVDYEMASQDGAPFESLIRKRKYLPNVAARFCTVELKVLTAKRYLRSIGWGYWTNCVGLRADEPTRLKEEGVKHGDRWTIWQPLANAGVSKADVSDFWKKQPFDLSLPNVNGKTPLGNCAGCFLKSESNLAALVRDYPEHAAWWERMENLATSLTSGSGATFSKRYSRRDLREMVERQGDWIFDDKAYLCQSDGGECME